MLNSICILRLSAIGDVTHVIPLVLSLQEQVPSVRVTWIIGKLEAKLVGDLPGVEFIIFDKKAGLNGYRDLKQQLSGRRFDALLHMQVALRANLASLLVRAPIRVGYDRARSKDLHGLFVNRRIASTSNQHVRDCLASFLEPLGLKAASPKWQIPVSEHDQAFARQWLRSDRRNLVISPCSSHTLRNWPAHYYAQLADHAISRHHMHVIVAGSPAPFEKAFCQEIESLMTGSATNICGKDTLKQLTALLANADLVVAPDTGPAHIASAVHTPVIGLYAASNPQRSGPYNSLHWCLNQYPQALQKYTGKSVEQARWGAKAEYPGAMEMITISDACTMLDQWHQAQSVNP